MKYFILFFISINSFAITDSVLDENYPGFHDFAAISFGPIKSYFRKLNSRSVILNGANGAEEMIIQDTNFKKLTNIKIQIDKNQTQNEIKETLQFSFPSGKKLTVLLTRRGSKVKFDSDQNLLLFKFDPQEDEEYFDLVIPEFQIQYQLMKTEQKEEAFYYLNFMPLNMEINTQITQASVLRDYLFFFNEMPVPQQQLSVEVKETKNDWDNLEFFHYTRGKGELSPKLFFEGLNQASGIFIGASQFYIGKLYDLGFPKFE